MTETIEKTIKKPRRRNRLKPKAFLGPSKYKSPESIELLKIASRFIDGNGRVMGRIPEDIMGLLRDRGLAYCTHELPSKLDGVDGTWFVLLNPQQELKVVRAAIELRAAKKRREMEAAR